MKRIVLKLSGEALGGKSKSGIDAATINEIAEEIKKVYDTSAFEIGIVVGGGNFFRGRYAKELGIERVECDYMGMTGTVLNALALKNALNRIGVKSTCISALELPQFLEKYTPELADSYLSNGYVTIYAGGTGRPYFSTDTATLLRAKETNSTLVLMAKNGVDGVYDKDPNTFKDAKKYEVLTHKEIIENKLEVMDLDAAAIANESNIDIQVFNMDLKDAILKSANGERIGTLITKGE